MNERYGVLSEIVSHKGRTSTDAVRAIEVKSISKSFVKGNVSFDALRDVDLTVDRGDFVAVVGPSGCGKSTLLRLLDGLDTPTAGTVLVDGEAMTKPRLDVGLMLQQPTLFPWRTALANVLLPVDVHRRRNRADVDRARELLALAKLEEFENHHPRELSGGMQQRVALCRVLMTRPSIMLLDEPFGALDDFTRELLNLELAAMVEAAADTTVVLVTHNIGEAVFLADRVITMGTAPGRILGEVPVEFARPRARALMSAPEFLTKVGEVRNALGLE